MDQASTEKGAIVRRPKRQPSPPPSPSVQRSTRRRKEHSEKSIAGLHNSSSEPWTDIADDVTAWPLNTETGGFEHDFEPHSAPDFEPDYDFGRDFGGGYSSGPEHSPFHPDGASQDQAPSSLKRLRIERNAKKQRNRRRTARAEAETMPSQRPELFQAYLLMRVLRQSGFVPSPDDEEWCDACHERRVTRKVRVFDLFFAGRCFCCTSFVSMRELRYCPCYSEIQTLAAHGLLPTSSSSIRKREGITAFTFRMIEYVDTYWGVDPFGIYGMSAALGPTMRQHLAMDEYRFMQQLQATLTAEILGLSPRERLADVCPACFGPRIDEAGKSENDLDVIIAVDGNFQHRRAKADPLKSRPALFLPPDTFRNEQALIDGSTEAGEKVPWCCWTGTASHWTVADKPSQEVSAKERLRTIARRWFSKSGLDHLWECTRQTGEPQMEEWVELRMWCTDDVDVFQQTRAGGLPDHTCPDRDCINDGMVGESDDITTDHDALLDISAHSSDDLSHHSVDTTDYGAFSNEFKENFDEDDGDVFGGI
ncbi:BQ5605_C008g04973 [Microbotryum silenes-dioicae]|uniref:BQ5605_C008g04973 protein n=1 Tax=Microbotryum silenes-dioicae TaxID=796604 RepID=A0A2X0MC02_9BASI|nr:BQ5605_C008g04973 [Microbotryum silenes-dioicae]